jgi:putative pyruvate formate lyase activating enzyme
MKRIYQMDGEIIFHDPGPELARVFAEIDPSYKVQSVQPGPGFTPAFQRLREQMVQIREPLIEMDSSELIQVFNENAKAALNVLDGDIISKSDILHTLALNTLGECRLCGWECGVNRYKHVGAGCGLSEKAFPRDPFIHIAEEAGINPAIVINFRGCSLKCSFCIDHEIHTTMPDFAPDPGLLWKKVTALQDQEIPITALEFTNPTESLCGLFEILAHSSAHFVLPVALNCHLYGSKSFYDLAGPITDVWLPDLRYGNDQCAEKLSGIQNYMKYVRIGLDEICSSGAKVIVRLLVLPGHFDCCHAPAIKLLSEYREHVWVSILDQYVPEHKAHLDSKLKARPTRTEISEVASLVKSYGLRNTLEGRDNLWMDSFWK